ncbi:hypothetical protein [Microbacterium algeriense]|uniref:YqaJ viral recombinase domain-containing protein n=1 Tax=Microbacterium algeriense TaxID=2615184 RepID=A0ABQ6VAD7_9MICO|nr:hypothetical protein [Microbacterium algeriense]KAB1867309.1 hypothetical protein F6A08_05850 [Microbacterium algeriense]
MSIAELPITAKLIVPEDAPRTVWMLERGEGVTASEVWAIARGGIKTWRRILEQKMNGSAFGGTKATKAGSAREAALLADAIDEIDWVEPNTGLWAAAENDRHRATPDGLGLLAGGLCTVEVKSHEHGYKGDAFPMDHKAQTVWQRYVLGAEFALYGAEIRDEDDMPPADGADWQFVDDPDDELLAFLIYRADKFLAWRDAGCPDFDDLPAEVAEAQAKWAPLKRQLDAAAAAEKEASDAVKNAIAKLPHAGRFGVVGMTEEGGFQSIVTESTSINEAAWRAADPVAHGRAEMLRVELALLEASAKQTFPKTTRRTSLRFQEAENV